MADTQLEPIQVGEFELLPTELFSIARSYLSGESAEEISRRLDIDPDDLVELLAHPEVFDKAIEARKSLIRLMVYGPLVDRLVTIASGSGDARSQVAAIKFLRELAEEDPGKAKKEGLVQTNVTHNTMNIIGQLPPGGFDSVVRQVEQAQDEKKSNVLEILP